MATSNWLSWARKIQAIAQTGWHYTTNPFDKERYAELTSIAAEITAAQTGAGVDDVKAVFAEQEGYATPRLDIRGVVFKDDKVLLVRELMDGGRWTLPGGWVDVDEPPSLAVEREVREEAGLLVRATKLLAVYDRNLHGHPAYYFHIYKLFILCELIGEAIADPLETADPTYFAQDDLPELSVGRVTVEEIKRFFEHHRNPDLPTDFD